jgi:hypothetical protein
VARRPGARLYTVAPDATGTARETEMPVRLLDP